MLQFLLCSLLHCDGFLSHVSFFSECACFCSFAACSLSLHMMHICDCWQIFFLLQNLHLGMLGITTARTGGCPRLQHGSQKYRRSLEPGGHPSGRRSRDAAEGPRMKPKILEARRSLRRPEASETLQRIKRAPEDPELIRRLQRTFGIASRARIG